MESFYKTKQKYAFLFVFLMDYSINKRKVNTYKVIWFLKKYKMWFLNMWNRLVFSVCDLLKFNAFRGFKRNF